MNFLKKFKTKQNDNEIIENYLFKEYKEKSQKLLLNIEKQNRLDNDIVSLFDKAVALSIVLSDFRDCINLQDYIAFYNRRVVWKDDIKKREKVAVRKYFGIKTDLHKRLIKDN